jgi:hypothetical protein
MSVSRRTVAANSASSTSATCAASDLGPKRRVRGRYFVGGTFGGATRPRRTRSKACLYIVIFPVPEIADNRQLIFDSESRLGPP